MFLPTEPEINARAEHLGLLDADGRLSSQDRKKVAKILLDEQRKATEQQPPQIAQQTLVSRTVTAVDDGHLIVEVWHKKGNRA